jgi:signal transduction histidine kinase
MKPLQHRLLLLCLLYSGYSFVLSLDTQAQEYVGHNFKFVLTADTNLIQQHLKTGHLLKAKGQMDSARWHYQQVLRESYPYRYSDGIIDGLISIALSYAREGKYDTALSIYNRSLKFCDTRAPSRKYFGVIYNAIGAVHSMLGNDGAAVSNLKLAIHNMELYKESKGTVETFYSNLAVVIEQVDEGDKAMYYLDKGEAIASKNKNKETLSYIYFKKSKIYAARKDTQRSKYYLKEALRTVGDNPSFQLILLNYMANTAIDEARYKEADSLLHIIEKRFKATNSTINYNLSRITSGKFYLKTHQLTKAEQYLQQALDITRKAPAALTLIKIHELLAEVYQGQQRYDQAFFHLQQEKQLSDSHYNVEKKRKLAFIETQFRSAQKDKDLIEKQFLLKNQQQLLTQKNLWIMLISVIAVCISILLIAMYRHYTHKQKLHQSSLQIREMKSIMNGEEKERTRMGRELHDSIMVQFSVVKMNLSTFLGANPSSGAPELRKILDQLDGATSSLRNTAHSLMPDLLLQEGLVGALDYFVDYCRSNTSIDIELLHYGSIPRFDIEFELSLYRIIQELLQNIMKHAQATHAIVQLSFMDHYLSVVVEDNGKGISPNKTNARDGLGLKSIEARVKAVNGRMSIESQEGNGLGVHLEFITNELSQHPS